ncbi:hypothetical protein AB0I82_33740 [Streptomyces sp. NPDC050315]|uniref:hypothetical protein n=1 Tax=Streptomyces sp. NPDC050315 TaxID=3155039 RepID=UPI00343EA8C1
MRVIKWRLSFNVPEDTKVDPDWAESHRDWLQVDHDVPSGVVTLENTSGYTIAPGDDLTLDIRVLFPREDPDFEHLDGLKLQQIA